MSDHFLIKRPESNLTKIPFNLVHKAFSLFAHFLREEALGRRMDSLSGP